MLNLKNFCLFTCISQSKPKVTGWGSIILPQKEAVNIYFEQYSNILFEQ